MRLASSGAPIGRFPDPPEGGDLLPFHYPPERASISVHEARSLATAPHRLLYHKLVKLPPRPAREQSTVAERHNEQAR